MAIRDGLLMEFEQEMASSRRMLERITDEKFGWKPHEKSMSLGALASHVAGAPGWTPRILKQDFVNVTAETRAQAAAAAPKNREQVLSQFDANVSSAKAALAETSDEAFALPWSFQIDGKVQLSMPRSTVFRLFVMSHTIHHRGQLSVYLRLNDIPVPATYGDSADEGR